MDSVSDSTGRDEAPRSPGAILAAERERQGLARADIAQRLHMSVSQVEALEAGDYARLPRGTFLRGFTRNYARSLGLDAEALVGLLTGDAPRENAPGIIVPSQNIRFDPLGARLASPYVKAAGIAAAMIVLGFAAMYWWLFIRPQGEQPAPEATRPAVASQAVQPQLPPPAETAAAEAAPAAPQAGQAPATSSLPAEPPAGQPAVTSSAPAVPGATAAPAPATPPAAAAEAPAAPAPAPRAAAPGEGAIHLAFRGAAWVEITDAKGRVLLSRTHPGGSTTEVAGKPPFTVVIGNAPEVRLTYNGRAFDLEPYTRVAVARFTLQ